MKIKLISPVLLIAILLFSSCEDKTVEDENNADNTKEMAEPESVTEVVLEPYTALEAKTLHANVLSLINQSEMMFEELFVLDSVDAPETVIASKADSALAVYDAFMFKMKETSLTARPETEAFIKASGKLIYHFMTLAKVHKEYARQLSVYEDDWSEENWNEWTSIVDPQYQDWIDAKEEFKAILAAFETDNNI